MKNLMRSVYLPSVLLVALAGTTANGAPIPEGGQVVVAPTSQLYGDGERVTLKVYAQNASGAGLQDLSFRGSVTAGSIESISEIGEGWYEVEWISPKAVEAGEAYLTLKARIAGRSFTMTETLPFQAPGLQPIQMSSSIPRLVIGNDSEATLSVQVPPELGLKAEDLSFSTSAGELGPARAVGNGQYRVRFKPPEKNFPQLAMITVTSITDPENVLGVMSLPLHGKVEFPVMVTPGATVLLNVGGREFGPSIADGSGRAVVPIEVPPGVNEAVSIVVEDGERAVSNLDLRVPESRRLQIFPVPGAIAADSGQAVRLHVAVFEPTGEPALSAPLDLSVTSGTLGEVKSVAAGVYEVLYTPESGRVASETTVQATIPGGVVQTDAVTLRLTPRPRLTVEVDWPGAQLSESQSELLLSSRVNTTSGLGKEGLLFDVRTEGAYLGSPVAELGSGRYEIPLDLELGTHAEVWVSPRQEMGATSAVRVFMKVAEGGQPGAVSVALATVDAYGFPVGEVEVDLSATEANAPVKIRTDALGHARFTVSLPSTQGSSALVANLRGSEAGELALVRSDAGIVPMSATWPNTVQTQATLWADAQQYRILKREGVAQSTEQNLLPEVPMAASNKEVVITPAKLERGQSHSVAVATTAESIEAFAGAGASVESISAQGEGRFLVNIAVSQEAGPEVKLSVVTPEGQAQVQVFSVVSPATEFDASLNVDTETSSTPQELPWFQLRAGMVASGYGYGFSPTDTPGGYLDEAVGWGLGEGGIAVPLGGEVQARVSVPSFRYLALQGMFRASGYAISGAAFEEPLKDVLYAGQVDLVGRVPVKVGSGVLSFMARTGFRYDDFVTLQGCLQEGCSLGYTPLGISGLGVYGGVGFEIGRFMSEVSFGGGFARGTLPYALDLDISLGVAITGPLYVEGGFYWADRDISLIGEQSGNTLGDLTDTQLGGRLGLGLRF